MSFSNFARLISTALPMVGLAALFAAGCNTSAQDESVDDDHEALSAEQCLYFDVNGKDQICHYTGSATHPYTIVRTSDKGCINGHTSHSLDYITSQDPSSPAYDPTCQGGGCLPVGAPVDATISCCEGLTVQDGVCTASSPCASSPCQNGGTCSEAGSGYTCACLPGWDGANCDVAGYSCSGTNNPCTSANIEAGLLFFPSAASPSNYVECSQLGDCYVQSCPEGTVWNSDQLQCI